MPAPANPIAAITRRAADRLRAGHLWVYRSDLVGGGTGLAPGSLATVVDTRGLPLGTALYSAASEIALRLVSKQPNLDRPAYLADLRTRLEAALALRREVAPEAFATAGTDAGTGTHTSACRLVFSEADNLPGIILDRYAGLVVAQLLTQGTAQPDVRAVLADVLAQHPWLHTVVERPDPRIRELEHLAPPPTEPIFTRQPTTEPTLQTTFQINGLSFHFDAAAGQKTGAFLDQRLNYAAAAAWVARSGRTARALDICTYQGGFALHLARVCTRVTGVDASRTALEVADRNLTLNASHLTATTDWLEADAFDLLREHDATSRGASAQRFDAIVLDPPAFAKSKRAAEGALRGYKELNLRALRLLAPGGTLVTCSCSHHVSLEDFTAILRSAAEDAGRRVQLLETRGAAPDHPAILTLPETTYLKCLIFRVA